MGPFAGLSHGEIIVLSALIAVTAFAVVSVFGFAVAYLITREPAAPATVANPAAPRVAQQPAPVAGRAVGVAAG